MDHRYKIVVSNRNLYKEIELSPEMKQLKIGTGLDCDVRLHKNLFFGQIELLFVKKGIEWSVQCSDNLYLTVGDIRKLMTKELQHGDTLEVKYFDSDNTVFHIEFIIDFDDGNVRYERIIDTSYQTEIRIGAGRANNIVISSPYVRNDTIALHQNRSGYTLEIIDTSYGVYHNGRLAENGEMVKNGDFISISDFFFCIKDGKVWSQIRDDLIVNSIRFVDKPSQNGYPKFNRSTRVKTLLNKEKIDILDPPAKAEKPKANLLQRLLPSMGMLVAAIFMASRGGAMIAFSIISGAMSIITAVIGLVEGKKEYKKKLAERTSTYNDYIDRKRDEIEQCREEELQALNEIYISQADAVENFDSFSPHLFDRRKEDDDFLKVRLGNGSIKSEREINYKKQEKLEIEDELQRLPGELCEDYKYIDTAPIVCAFKEANAIGIVGEEQFRFDLLKNIVLDICARQFHSDVKMAFIAQPEYKERVHWFRTLPHVWCDAINSRLIVSDNESKNLVFEYLYKEIAARRQNKGYDEHIVVFFYNEYGFKNHPISKFVDEAAKLGISFVFFADSVDDIPMGCSAIVDITDARNATLIHTNDKEKSIEFEYPRVSEQEMQDIIDILTPVYTEELSLEGTLTKNISMFEMLNIIAVDDIDLEKRWTESNIAKSMAAPLGVSKTGIVNLDLHDKAHGPHGLVAGTTGSGKSEILQTYILAMATLFHPYEVGFVIIDFKGGGMVNQFRKLPHLVGAITNIDGKEIDRSLKSIKAELQKRQRLFAEAEVNHISKYITKFKAGEIKQPLPHLIIIVDEFAELKAEQPEFMKELISAARIGRSLGVHLILATQKPSGQVNEQIWSNSRFKLCLKVQTQEDSNEVLKSPLAAEIREPGRAYLQVGNNEIFELFQSAYSGAPEKTDDGNVKEFTIYNIADSGKRIPVFTQKKKKGDGGGNSQLDAIVDYVAKFCSNKGIESLPDICLPALEKHITVPERAVSARLEALPLGVYDDPDCQYQGDYSVDLTTNNMLVIGSIQTGKTNLLQTIIRNLAAANSPDEVNIYAIDFASMSLKTFEGLNHMGGVVLKSDDEKLKNLFKLISSEIQQRREKMISVGVSSFSSYREAGYKDLPLIVLMIDNLTELRELYFSTDDDELLSICREGLPVGISVVIANSTLSGIGYRLLSNFSERLAFYCNDSGEYSNLFEHCRETVENIPGRCMVKIENNRLDCQIYSAFQGEREIDRAREIAGFISEINEKYPNQMARIIPEIPDLLTAQYVNTAFMPLMQGKNSLVVGLNYADISPVVFDFSTLGVLGLAGGNGSQASNFISYIVKSLQIVHPGKSQLYVIDSVAKPLLKLRDEDNVERYEVVQDRCEAIFSEISTELERRYQNLANDVIEEYKQIVLIVNSWDMMELLDGSMVVKDQIKAITGKYKSLGICIIVGDCVNASIGYNAPELMKKLRDNPNYVFFDDLNLVKMVDLPLSRIRDIKKKCELGDAFYIKEDECLRIKTVLAN